MDLTKEQEYLNSVTEKIIGCAFAVSRGLGVGFLEKVYENALAHEIGKTGLKVEQQVAIKVIYDGIVVGDYIADLLVDEKVIIELKAVGELQEVHVAQALNYLKATGHKICLLLNFGQPKLQIRRIVNNF